MGSPKRMGNVIIFQKAIRRPHQPGLQDFPLALLACCVERKLREDPEFKDDPQEVLDFLAEKISLRVSRNIFGTLTERIERGIENEKRELTEEMKKHDFEHVWLRVCESIENGKSDDDG